MRLSGRIFVLAGLPIIPLMYRENYRANRKWTLTKLRPIEEVLSSPNHSTLTRWYWLVRPFIFQLTEDPENAHKIAVISGSLIGEIFSIFNSIKRNFRSLIIAVANHVYGPSIFPRRGKREDGAVSRLYSNIGGLSLNLPIGLSAGFDKNAQMVNFFLHNNLSIGFAEMGSISALPWLGNPRPRVFRLPEDKAVINRMGLNNDGAQVMAERITNSDLSVRCVGCSGTPCGVNITKTPDSTIEGEQAVEDFKKSFVTMIGLKNVKWITLNISCPNTAEGKTFEDINALESLLESLTSVDRGTKKLFLKLAPLGPTCGDGDDWKSKSNAIINVAKKFGIDALIIANTVADRQFDGLKSEPKIVGERGGLSGRPIFERSIPLVRFAAKHGIDVIAVGGVSAGHDVYRLIRNGARAVQLYTALVYDGPGVFLDIANGLERDLLIGGHSKLEEIIGIDL